MQFAYTLARPVSSCWIPAKKQVGLCKIVDMPCKKAKVSYCCTNRQNGTKWRKSKGGGERSDLDGILLAHAVAYAVDVTVEEEIVILRSEQDVHRSIVDAGSNRCRRRAAIRAACHLHEGFRG